MNKIEEAALLFNLGLWFFVEGVEVEFWWRTAPNRSKKLIVSLVSLLIWSAALRCGFDFIAQPTETSWRKVLLIGASWSLGGVVFSLLHRRVKTGRMQPILLRCFSALLLATAIVGIVFIYLTARSLTQREQVYFSCFWLVTAIFFVWARERRR